MTETRPVRFTAAAMDEASAHAIATWRYPEPYSVYDPGDDVAPFLDPANRYHSVFDEEGNLVGYWCFGPDSRVPGGDYSEDALDVGGGLRPDLVGRRLGPAFLRAGIGFAIETLDARAFRVTVATFNERSIRLCETMGFLRWGEFDGPGGRRFVQFVR